ncbi:hypothetical protein A1351_08560 [Methylosinus sp. R-45379]|nr:hypothetical protein A1351_08560 [Methylosinus sp. R-45379]
MRGTFPTIAKDDVAAFILGSVIYYFIVLLFTAGINSDMQALKPAFSSWLWLLILLIIPAFVGFGFGILESSDAVGYMLRSVGIRLPSPHATAWETLFRELTPGSVLLVGLKDGSHVYGRWIGGKGGSASSTDAKTLDLFLGEIGVVDTDGQYVPQKPQRGAYIAASEIRVIEVVSARRS